MGLLFPVRYLKPKCMDPPFPERVGKSLSLVSLIQRPMGRFSVVFLFAVLYLSFGRSANAVRDANNKLFVFAGKIQAVTMQQAT